MTTIGQSLPSNVRIPLQATSYRDAWRGSPESRVCFGPPKATAVPPYQYHRHGIAGMNSIPLEVATFANYNTKTVVAICIGNSTSAMVTYMALKL